MLALKNLRGSLAQHINYSDEPTRAGLVLADPDDFDPQFLNSTFPELSLCQTKEANPGMILFKGLEHVEELPFRSALSQSACNEADVEAREIKHWNAQSATPRGATRRSCLATVRANTPGRFRAPGTTSGDRIRHPTEFRQWRRRSPPGFCPQAKRRTPCRSTAAGLKPVL